MSANVLPDSRLREPKRTLMLDMEWEEVQLDGSVIPRNTRIEFEPIFCISCCRKECGYVPVGIVTHASWLCAECSEKYGISAAESESSDHEFWRKVNDEMINRFGRVLTGAEIDYLAAQGKLGARLELLDRESPYRKAAR